MRFGVWLKAFLLLGITVCLGACTGRSLESGLLDDSTEQLYGVTYSLPRGYLPLKIEADGQGGIKIIEPTQRVLPDQNAKFKLAIRTSGFASDTTTISTTADGLLAAVNAVNEDKSSEIVKKVIELVTNLAVVTSLRFDKKKTPPRYSVTTIIDPFNPGGELRRVAAITGLELTLTDLSGHELRPYSFESEAAIAANCDSSVCFRVLTPVMLTIEDKAKTLFARFIVLVPNPYLIGTYDVRRAPCIKKTNNLEFINGVLTKVTVDKPSEVLGCLQIPIDVAKAIVSIPGELVKVKIEQSNRDAQLAQAQANAITAQINLLNAQAAYLARISSQPPAKAP